MLARRPTPPPRLARSLTLLALTGLFGILFLAPHEVWAGSHTTSTTWKDAKASAKSHKSWGYSYTTNEYDGPNEIDAYVFTRDDGHSRNGSGDTRDWKEAEALREEMDARSMLWFRRGDDRYVITDRDLLEQIDEMLAPQLELGRQQGALGRKQGELGRLQGELGQKQGKLGRMQADISRRHASLVARLAAASLSDRDADLLEQEQEAISRQQNEIGELQSELGAQQAKLGERQSVLGAQQAELGRQQEKVSKQVQRQLEALALKAIEDGTAKPVDR